MSAYLNIFDAIQTSWRDLYDCLHTRSQLKLCKYIRDEEYLYSSLTDDSVPFNNFSHLLECLYDQASPFHYRRDFLINFDIFNTDIEEINKFLSIIKEIFTENKLMDENLLIERRDHLGHCTEDQQAMDIEEINLKQEDARKELNSIAIGMNLQNYQVRNFIRIGIF